MNIFRYLASLAFLVTVFAVSTAFAADIFTAESFYMGGEMPSRFYADDGFSSLRFIGVITHPFSHLNENSVEPAKERPFVGDHVNSMIETMKGA